LYVFLSLIMPPSRKPAAATDSFDAVALSIASPEDVINWSRGEVTKPETVNYRTQRAEPDGLFCERIFAESIKESATREWSVRSVAWKSPGALCVANVWGTSTLQCQ